jgi:hypothetical protein
MLAITWPQGAGSKGEDLRRRLRWMAGLVCAKQIAEKVAHLVLEDNQIGVNKAEHRIVVNGTMVVGEEISEINNSP